MTNVDPAYVRATHHVKNVRDFAYHLMVYTVVNTLLVLLDLRGGTGANAVFGLDFAYWLIIFWGFGLLGHAISVFIGDHQVQRFYDAEDRRSRSVR